MHSNFATGFDTQETRNKIFEEDYCVAVRDHDFFFGRTVHFLKTQVASFQLSFTKLILSGARKSFTVTLTTL
jgi:hypothetical protein